MTLAMQLAEQFVEDITTEALFTWCDIYGIPHNEDQWLDDEWPKREDELRVKLAERMGQ